MKNFLIFCLAAFVISNSDAQKSSAGWTGEFRTPKVFIENQGQFNACLAGNQRLTEFPGSEIVYATPDYSNQVLFSKTGLIYHLEERRQPTVEQREEREAELERAKRKGKVLSHQEMEREEHRLIIRREYVQMKWENANPDVEIIALEPVEGYFNYALENKSIDHLSGYRKLIYKNLYANIDVEYIFSPKGGIEYSFLLHPGADPSVIKMTYPDLAKISNDIKGNLLLGTIFGNIIEHAPRTFYSAERKTSTISSKFIRKGKSVAFALENYDRNREVVIDPWVQTPAFNTQWDCIWECDKDAAGNVYVIGGVMPEQLLKYSPSGGAPLWTYNTPYDTANFWLGTLATDYSGNCYITGGSIAAIEKINTLGGLVWNNPSPGGIFSTAEFWSISFNWDQTKLVIGGTGGAFLPPLPYVYQVDMSNGNVTNSVQVTGGGLFPTQEVRAIAACSNGRYFYLSHDSIGFLNENLGACANPSFYVPTDYHLGYKCENFRVNNTGISALRSYGGYGYVNLGNMLYKRDLSTLSIVGAVSIPGGAFSTSFGSSYVENSGIDIDACGNIYVGSKNQVVKFDQNLSQLATYPTTYNVYDVHVNTGGDIIVCGSLGTSASGARSGYIQAISVAACAPVVSTPCDANICRVGPFCTTDPPITLSSSTSGGTWSGAGITNSATGAFSPSVAGPGTHYIKNTVACGSDSIPIVVNLCASLQACAESNGNITVSNGTSPYTWQSQSTSLDCSGCPLGFCFPPLCNGVTVITWTTFTTGATATPPGTWPIRVMDNSSNMLVITSLASLPACATCQLTASASSTNAICGLSNGSATAVAGGATPTSYHWSNGATTALASNLSAGNYSVTITSTGCTATASTTVISSGSVSATASSTPAGCLSNGIATVTPSGGTGTFAYLWNNGNTTSSISNLSAGIYSVTVISGSCNTTASTTVNSTGGVTASASVINAGCTANGSATVTSTGGNGTFTYLWSTGGTASIISNLPVGTYLVTVTSGSCTATASAAVNSSGTVAASASSVNAGCAGTGSATATAGGGTGTYSYLWSNGGTMASISNLPAGTYSVTVTSGTCSATASTVVGAANAVTASATSTPSGCVANGSAAVTAGGGNGTFSYLWSNGGTTSSISNIAAGLYWVTVTSGTCTATASTTVNSTGSVTANTSTSSAGCSSTGSATVTPGGGTGSFSYLWNTGGTTAVISNISAGNYSVTVTSGTCTATATATVASSGGVTLSVTSGGTTCGVNNGSAGVTPTTGNPPYNYSWTGGSTAASLSNLTAGTYTVTVSDLNGCSATASASISSSSVRRPTIIYDKNIMCSGDSAHLCVDSVYISYLWNTGPVDQCIYARQAGNYYVTVTDHVNCTVESSHLAINIYSNPPVSISVNGDTLRAYNATAYQWYRNTVAIPNATDSIYIVTLPGDYTVGITDGNGCTATSTKVTVTKTGIAELSLGGVNIYPNPLESGMWHIEVPNNFIGGEFQIFDAEGRLVFKSEIRSAKSEINLSVSSGFYTMRISSEEIIISRKLVKL